MPKSKWQQCAHTDVSRYWHDDNLIENINEEVPDNNDTRMNVDIPPNHEFQGEIEISSDESQVYPYDLEDSSLEDEFLHKDGVDL